MVSSFVSRPGRHRSTAAFCILISVPALALADDNQNSTMSLPDVSVVSAQSSSLQRLTEPLLDTPQTIIEVPAQQAIDQGVFTMEDALRYVPGVNFHANEDTSQRNQYYGRGFSAENDRYLDGMVEIGDWYMDTFDMERLEVLEGPAGVLFGRGSTGGVVNYVSKAPRLSSLTEIGTSFGTDGTKRATLDFDRVVGDTTALRINVVGYDGDVADRDRVNFRPLRHCAFHCLRSRDRHEAHPQLLASITVRSAGLWRALDRYRVTRNDIPARSGTPTQFLWLRLL
jgi:outer membrane receptor for monomeric catechols